MFDTNGILGRILLPDEVRLLQRVIGTLKVKGCLPLALDQQREFASYLLTMYQRGLVLEEKLVDFGVVAARHRYQMPLVAAPPPDALALFKVMLVEDEYELARHLKLELSKAGAQVIGPFSDEEAALEALEYEVPDAAVVDLNLGRGVQFEIAKALTRQAVPTCVYSGYSRAELRDVPHYLDSSPWLEKPTGSNALVAALSRMLARPKYTPG